MLEKDNLHDLICGDPKAFNFIYKKYNSRLFGFANSYVRDSFIAGNLVQDAFMALWENRSKISTDTKISAYLLTIVKNMSLNHLNRLKTQMRVEDDMQKHYLKELELRCSTLDACNPETMFRADVETIIQKTIESLPDQCRKVIIYSRFRGMSHKEIAERLHISVKGVEFHITRALKSLKTELKDYITVCAGFLSFFS